MYDLANSVVKVLHKEDLLNYLWLQRDPAARKTLSFVLAQKKFEPRTKNEDLRKYRYPQKRAEQIVKASKRIYSNKRTIKKILHEAATPDDARKFFADNVPGLGFKEASHFLRNIQYCNSLAIIDVHVLYFMKKHSLLEVNESFSLTANNYIKLENILRNFTGFHGLNLGIFDLAIWSYIRDSKT